VIDANRGQVYNRKITVQIWHDDRFQGTGFFFGHGIVITCAHVVWPAPDGVEVRWQGRLFTARVVARDPEEPGKSAYYAFPDLAFVRLDSPPYHPIAVSRRIDSEQSGKIHAFGYSTETPEPGVVEHVASLEIAGPSGRFYRLKGDEVLAGMSGAPAIDSRSGALIGVVKATRDYRDDRGGWVTPTGDVIDSAERFAAVLNVPDLQPAITASPAPGSPLYRLLEAQRVTAEILPYQLVEGRMPQVSQVYVAQRTADRKPRAGWVAEATMESTETISVATMLTRHRHALVVGGPGSGKSTLMQHIVVKTAQWWLSAGGPNETPPFGLCIAVRASARDLLQGRPWLDSLAVAVDRQAGDYLDSSLNPSMFTEPPLPHVEWMVLVDGLDEIIDGRRRARLIHALAYHIAEYGNSIRFVITTRDLPETDLDGLRLQLFPPVAAAAYGEYALRPFDGQALRTFAGNWFRAAGDPAVDNRVDEFLQRVAESRITELIHVPLLATIGLTVFERDPASPLPLDRAGLYGRFILGLLHERRARIEARAAVRTQLLVHGASAERVGEFLYDQTEACLEWIAEVRLRNEATPTIETAVEWLETHFGNLPAIPGLADRVRDLLVSTGLLFVGLDESLEFAHHTFAEYFAAGRLARQGLNGKKWLRTARRDGLNNVMLFTFARWVQGGNDALPTMRRLFRFGWAIGYRNLDLIAAILYDGIPTDPVANRQIVETAHRYLRWARIGEEHKASLRSVLPALRQRDATHSVLHRLINTERASVAVRVEACCVLIEAGGADNERDTALRQLANLAFAPGRPAMARLWPLYRLVELGDPAEQNRAAQRLVGMVLCTTDPAVLAYAVTLLARLGLHGEAAKGLLLRAAWRWHPVSTRMQALDMFVVVSHKLQPIADSDEELRRLGGSVVLQQLLQERDGRADESYHRMLAAAAEIVRYYSSPGVVEAAIDHALRDPALAWWEQVAAAEQMFRQVPRSAAVDCVVARLVNDPAIPAAGRILLAGDMMSGLSQRSEGIAALVALAENDRLSIRCRLAAARMMFRHGEADAAVRQVAAWAGDEQLSRWSRSRAALVLARQFGEYDQAVAQLADATSLPLRGLGLWLRLEGRSAGGFRRS
jgi:hypothetical protein